MDLTIKPLSPELAADYLDFFDRRAFSDGSPYYPCYCCAFQMTRAQIHEEFMDSSAEYGGETEGLRLAMRSCAEKMIAAGRLRGYLAFDGTEAVGWCNANDKTQYVRTGEFSIDEIPEEEPSPADEWEAGMVKSIVCFAVAPAYRGRGVASALVRRVCADALAEGFAAVEAYPVLRDKREPLDFTGPVGLYERAGFTAAGRRGDTLVMRKNLPKSSCEKGTSRL